MRAQLQKAHAAAALRGTLDEALQCPLLRRCLEITAHALANSATLHTYVEASSPAHAARASASRAACRPDFKRASAADLD